MSSAERVAKYYSDAQALVQAKPLNQGKIKSEIAKLATWLRKHQTEELTDGSKQQLMTCIQMYQKVGVENSDLKDAAFTLVDDALKLPEGKLITSKSKKQCLKWLEALTGDADPSQAVQDSSNVSLLTVIEAETGKVTLMEEDTGDTVEDVTIPDAALFAVIKVLRSPLQERFDSGEDVVVEYASEDRQVLRLRQTE